MKNMKDAIIIICNEMGISPELILKRGKPGALQRDVRKKAENYMKSGTFPEKVEIDVSSYKSQNVYSGTRVVSEPKKVNARVEEAVKKVRSYDSALMRFGGLSNLSNEKKTELDKFVSDMSPALKKFYHIGD